LGKLIGVFLSTWAIIQLGFGSLPEGSGWRELAGVSLLCKIGFTMSLFIGSLAFEHAAGDYASQDEARSLFWFGACRARGVRCVARRRECETSNVKWQNAKAILFYLNPKS